MRLRHLPRYASAALTVFWRVGVLFLTIVGAFALMGLTGHRALLLAAALSGLTVFSVALDWYVDRGEWLLRRRRYITQPGRKTR